MQLADFPPIKKYRSVPEPYYVPYPDKIYPEAVQYLIGIADRTGDSSMTRQLKSYMKNPTALKCRILSYMFHKKSHGGFIDNIIADLRSTSAVYNKRTFSEKEELQYANVHRQAESAMKRFTEKGYECLLYREEPFMYSKDSITYKEHVMVFRNGMINRHCDIYTYEYDGI